MTWPATEVSLIVKLLLNAVVSVCSRLICGHIRTWQCSVRPSNLTSVLARYTEAIPNHKVRVEGTMNPRPGCLRSCRSRDLLGTSCARPAVPVTFVGRARNGDLSLMMPAARVRLRLKDTFVYGRFFSSLN